MSNEEVSRNTRLSQRDKVAFKNDLEAILARGILTNPCPLNEAEQAELYNLQFPMSVREALQTLHAFHQVTHHYRDRDVYITVGGWMVRFIHQPGTLYADRHTSPFLAFGSDHYSIPLEVFTNRCGARWDSIWKWMQECDARNKADKETHEIFQKILSMCTTSGQLFRVVPEALSFVPNNKADALSYQVKKSPLPSGFFSIDHSALERARNRISLCQLLPKVGKDMATDSRFYTWAYNG